MLALKPSLRELSAKKMQDLLKVVKKGWSLFNVAIQIKIWDHHVVRQSMESLVEPLQGQDFGKLASAMSQFGELMSFSAFELDYSEEACRYNPQKPSLQHLFMRCVISLGKALDGEEAGKPKALKNASSDDLAGSPDLVVGIEDAMKKNEAHKEKVDDPAVKALEMPIQDIREKKL